MPLTQVETSGLSGSGASSNSTTGNVFSQTGPFKNRIINGDCRIDQRNAGASVTPADGAYTLDRWQYGATQSSKVTIQQSTTAPTGFSNSLLVTSSSAYSVGSGDVFRLSQLIEGFNFADLGWGTANAKTVTLSFWVRSSLTGTFGGAFVNNASDRSYPFTYSISSANTWEYKTISVTGDTSGTWVGSTNGIGVRVHFGLGIGSGSSGPAGAWAGAFYISATGATSVVGTNGATFYITGVQLEAGTSATQFERRSYGQELALCQRYYEKSYNIDTTPGTVTAVGFIDVTANSQAANVVMYPLRFAVTKRAAPSITGYTSSSGASGSWDYIRSGASGTGSFTADSMGTNGARIYTNVGAAWTAAEIQGHYTASAEL